MLTYISTFVNQKTYSEYNTPYLNKKTCGTMGAFDKTSSSEDE